MKYDTTRADNLLDKNALMILEMDESEYIEALKRELDRAMDHIYCVEDDMSALEAEVADLQWKVENMEEICDSNYWNPQDI